MASLDVLVVMMLVMGAHGTSAESTKTVKARLDVIDILCGKIDLLGGFASDVIDASRGGWGFASDDVRRRWSGGENTDPGSVSASASNTGSELSHRSFPTCCSARRVTGPFPIMLHLAL